MALSDELNAPRRATRHSKTAEARADNGAAHKPKAAASPAGEGPRLVLDGGYARLKLDMDEPIVPATPTAAASGAQIGLTDLDDPAVRELHALEQSVQAMKRAEQANRDQTTRLQAQLAQAQERGDWFPWMLGALGVAVAAIAALAWRMRQQSRLGHHAWFEESQISRSAPAPAPTPEPSAFAPLPPQMPTSPQDLPPPVVDYEIRPEYPTIDLHEPPESASDAVVADASATQPLDRTALAGLMAQEAAAPRELSVEELLDLEQQADFFIALGQEDAAVDLLMSHLRSAGGQSPLPYTKLLEIYRRQGDRSAYERTRARFNRRFNAYAPDWDTGPSAGRTLEDYPETIALIQAAWASPIDAMAVLEGLLFKRDDTSELFDLPAYRDVLVLYSLARDLWLQGGGTTGTQVDVLLPLDDPYGVGGGAPGAQINGLELPIAGAPIRDDFKPTALSSALDLEIPSLDELPAGHVQVDDGVHATLDALSLAPIDPSKSPASPDWDSGRPSPDDVPTKR